MSAVDDKSGSKVEVNPQIAELPIFRRGKNKAYSKKQAPPTVRDVAITETPVTSIGCDQMRLL